jgi:general secretion pathway protein K
MVPMSLQFITSTFFYNISAANLSNSVIGGCVARSGFHFALAVLFEDTLSNDFDSLHESWADSEALSSDAASLFEDAGFGIEIIDHSGKVNINRLVFKEAGEENEKFDEMQQDVVTQLLKSEELDLEEDEVGDIVNAIKDWIDSDDEVTEEGGFGAESAYYLGLNNPYSCRNAPFETLEELRLVKGVTPEIFSEISKYLTVYGDKEGKINVNTADKYLLKALSEDIHDEEADTMIKYREEADIDDLRDEYWYQKALNTQEELIYPDLVTTKSTYFEIKATGSKGGMGKKIRCIVERKEKNLSVLSWKIEDK